MHMMLQFDAGARPAHAREFAGWTEGEAGDDAVEDCSHIAVHNAVVQAIEVLPTRVMWRGGDRLGWGKLLFCRAHLLGCLEPPNVIVCVADEVNLHSRACYNLRQGQRSSGCKG